MSMPFFSKLDIQIHFYLSSPYRIDLSDIHDLRWVAEETEHLRTAPLVGLERPARVHLLQGGEGLRQALEMKK